MNVLEKILKELEKRKQTHKDGLVLEVSQRNIDEIRVRVSEMERVEEIIRSHMDEVNDANVPSNWIPCSERLPEETGYYLVQLSKKLPNEDYADRVVVLYNAEEKEFMCYEKLIKAWQPLPEPYKGGKENE